jgi:hemerythrin-like domain-containing protein
MMPSTMTPTDVLREEHRVILRALDLLEAAARSLTAGTVLPEVWWLEIIAWLRGFADRNHHAKEETSLFPAMVKAGVPSMGGPIGVMLEEHERGRALIRAMEAAEPAARAAGARADV